MTKPNKLWAIKWEATWEKYPASLWIIAGSAETAAKKARSFLKRQGNTAVQIKTIEQNGTIDVF